MTHGDTDPVFMEALGWLVRLKDDKASDNERRAFAAWIEADPAHAAAFAKAQTLWQRFDVVVPEYEKLRKSDGLGRRDVILGGLGAIIAGASVYAIMRPGFFAGHDTGIGERKSFSLADGSTVELGSYSSLSVDFSPRQRRLILHRGQGFFDVAPGNGRPFIVNAGDGTVRAAGTRFDIKFVDERATVSVLEHAVSVSAPGARSVTVEEDWQVGYSGHTLGRPVRFDRTSVEAWRRGRLVFKDTPLRFVLRELERYYHGRIVLMDESLGDIKVTAVFNTSEASDALYTIQSTLPVRVIDAAGLLALVYRA